MTSYTQEELEQAISRCETEPIHQIGQIQPHGALIVLSADNQRFVLQASDNLAEFIDLPADGLYGKPLIALLGEPESVCVEKLIQNANNQQAAIGSINILRGATKQPFNVRVFTSNSVIVMELTPDDGGHERLADLLLPMQQALLQSEDETDAYRYFDRIATITRELLGFDRVMIYRFDPNWDGEVIAESRVESEVSYLGNHFPASDIPPQARRLYTQNLVRLVSDVAAQPVSISPALNPVTCQPLDMTHSALRSFSTVHVEYLRNMGVQASMSISLLQNGRLWGLIACHHMAAKQVPSALQDAAAFVSRMVSSKLSLIESNEQHNLEKKAIHIIGELLKHLNANSAEAIQQRLLPDLMGLLDASGMLMRVEGQLFIAGEVPAQVETNDLLSWLGSQAVDGVFTCDYLSRQFAPALTYAGIASGVLAASLAADMKNCIVWLRKEKIRTIKWAGKPEKTVRQDSTEGLRLCPRKSFENWTESWRGRSTPWSHIEKEIAGILSRALTEGMMQKCALELANTRLKNSTAEIERFFSLSLDLLCIADMQGHFLRLNNAWEATLGYPLSELEGRAYLDYVHPDDVDATLLVMSRLSADRNVMGFTNRYRCKDGSYRWIEWHSMPYKEELIYAVARDVTERKRIKERELVERIRAEEMAVAIAKSERFIKAITNNLPGMVGYWDKELICRFANKAYLEWFGKSPAEMIGIGMREFMGEQLFALSEPYVCGVLAGEKQFFERTLTKANGSIGYTFASYIPDFDAEGEVTGFFVLVADVTPMKEIENTLVQKENRYQTLFESISDSVFAFKVESDGRLILAEVNDAACTRLGYRRNELLGTDVVNLDVPGYPRDKAAVMQKIRQHGHALFESMHQAKDGRQIPVEVSVRSYKLNGVEMTLGVARDITDRKLVEDELRNSEEKFRQLFEKAPIGIAMTKQDQRIFAANAAYCKMFGYTQEELRNLTISDLTHPDFVDTTKRMAIGLLEGEIPSYAFEKQYRRKDGSSFWGSVIATQMPTKNSQESIIMGIVKDITERIERETLRLSEVLEQRDALVREVHHRIKNNLQGVVGLLRQHAIDHPELKELIDVVIGRIYSIAIIHGLQAQTLVEEVKLDSLIKAIIDASEGNVSYRNDLQSPVFLSRDESVPIALVLNELITNACKHRLANTTLEVRLCSDSDGSLITITNSFEVGKQQDAGGGQGLALVKSLLPRKYARLLAVQKGNMYSVELKLSPPVASTEGVGANG